MYCRREIWTTTKMFWRKIRRRGEHDLCLLEFGYWRIRGMMLWKPEFSGSLPQTWPAWKGSNDPKIESPTSRSAIQSSIFRHRSAKWNLDPALNSIGKSARRGRCNRGWGSDRLSATPMTLWPVTCGGLDDFELGLAWTGSIYWTGPKVFLTR